MQEAPSKRAWQRGTTQTPRNTNTYSRNRTTGPGGTVRGREVEKISLQSPICFILCGISDFSGIYFAFGTPNKTCSDTEKWINRFSKHVRERENGARLGGRTREGERLLQEHQGPRDALHPRGQETRGPQGRGAPAGLFFLCFLSFNPRAHGRRTGAPCARATSCGGRASGSSRTRWSETSLSTPPRWWRRLLK